MKSSALIALAALATGAGAAAGSSARGLSLANVDRGAITISTPEGSVEVLPVSDGIYRVRHIPASDPSLLFLPSQSAVLAETQSEGPTDSGQYVVMFPDKAVNHSSLATVSIDRNTGLVSFLRPDGSLLLRETLASGNDNPDLKRISLLSPGSRNIYGAGERGHSLRLNPGGNGVDSLSMYNRQNYGYTGSDPRISQMGISVPYIASDNGFGILFDDFAKASLQFRGDTIQYTSESPFGISYYVMTGDAATPSLAEQTEMYTRLTGRQPLPPLWALGYITSKYGYHDRKETEEVVDRLKNAGYPLDGVVLDLYWYGVEQDMGRLEWNAEKWPDHAEMLRNLADKGINMILISQPYVNKGGAIDNYNLLSEAGMLVKNAEGNTHDVTTWVGDAGMIDVSNPATREWLWNRLRGLTSEGVAGWWGDLGEPEVHPSTIIHDNGMTAEQYHNAYGNEWSRLIYDGLRKDFPAMRPLLMMRGGTAGLQRYGVFPWTTDVSRSWGGLEPQIRLMLSSGLSGLGYMGSDVGGFAVDPEHPTDPELYVRWLQMGTFSPMLRTHAQEQPEPFNYPGVEEISKRFIKMRYEWLPYNYTLAYENATTGAPLARPLNFYGARDEKYADVGDEYLWGRDVLVAPVLTKGAKTRKVLFPEGEWVSWTNPSRRFKGGSTATVQAPLSELPLFVRAGAVIPLFMRPAENTRDYDGRFLTLRYFRSSEESESVIFDDDHLSPTSLEDNAYQLLQVKAIPETDGSLTFDLSATGRFEGMPSARQITLEIPATAKAAAEVTLNGRSVPFVSSAARLGDEGWTFDAATHLLTLRFNWGMELLRVEISPAVSLK